jgi:hypothetical protein
MSAVVEGMSHELDLFERPIMQTGVVGGNWHQFKATSADVDAAQLEFRIPNQGDQYLDLSRTLFDIKVQFIKQDGTKYAVTDKIAPINNLFDSLWSNVKVELNQKCVSDSRNMYHYKAYIDDLFNYNNTAKTSHLTAFLWAADTAGQFDYTAENKGAVKRKGFTDASKVLNLAG